MIDELKFILNKYNIDDSLAGRLLNHPIEIPNMKRDDGLAPLFAELEYEFGVEIGVERGMYSEVLCKANPQAKIYSVDPWQAYRGYRDHVSQEKLDGFYEDALARLAPYDCELVRKYSSEAVEGFDDGGIDFVYIDGNHRLENIINDIAMWEKKVKRGGIISGHDFRQFKKQTFSHVPEAVRAYTQSYRIHPWFLCGLRSEPKGMRDSARSWFWVKA
jgi:hypothetical protein